MSLVLLGLLLAARVSDKSPKDRRCRPVSQGSDRLAPTPKSRWLRRGSISESLALATPLAAIIGHRLQFCRGHASLVRKRDSESAQPTGLSGQRQRVAECPDVLQPGVENG